MLYVSVRWSKLQGLNLRRSVSVIGRIDDMMHKSLIKGLRLLAFDQRGVSCESSVRTQCSLERDIIRQSHDNSQVI